MRLRDVVVDCAPGVGLFTGNRRVDKEGSWAKERLESSGMNPKSLSLYNRTLWKGVAYSAAIAAIQVTEFVYAAYRVAGYFTDN